MIYGYCRVSTKKQNLERQVENISKAFPKAKLYKEKFTGTELEGRTELKKLLKVAKEGDTIVFDSVSRMSRNAEQGFELYQELYTKGIELVFLKESYINTEVYKQTLSNRIAEQKIETGKKSTDNLVNGMLELLQAFAMDMAKEQIRIAFEQAEKEVADLRQRISEGMQVSGAPEKISKANSGKKYKVKKTDGIKSEIIKYSNKFDGTFNNKEVARILNVHSNTIANYIKEIESERN